MATLKKISLIAFLAFSTMLSLSALENSTDRSDRDSAELARLFLQLVDRQSASSFSSQVIPLEQENLVDGSETPTSLSGLVTPKNVLRLISPFSFDQEEDDQILNFDEVFRNVQDLFVQEKQVIAEVEDNVSLIIPGPSEKMFGGFSSFIDILSSNGSDQSGLFNLQSFDLVDGFGQASQASSLLPLFNNGSPVDFAVPTPDRETKKADKKNASNRKPSESFSSNPGTPRLAILPAAFSTVVGQFAVNGKAEGATQKRKITNEEKTLKDKKGKFEKGCELPDYMNDATVRVQIDHEIQKAGEVLSGMHLNAAVEAIIGAYGKVLQSKQKSTLQNVRDKCPLARGQRILFYRKLAPLVVKASSNKSFEEFKIEVEKFATDGLLNKKK